VLKIYLRIKVDKQKAKSLTWLNKHIINERSQQQYAFLLGHATPSLILVQKHASKCSIDIHFWLKSFEYSYFDELTLSKCMSR